MAGATFLRADLHVHSFVDTETDPEPDLEAYVRAAAENDITFLAITDHNTARFARAAVEAATKMDTGVYVVPGVEISTHDGHLLALFSPEELDALESFATQGNLQLKKLSDTEKRSDRSMLDLVRAIDGAGGLAIPAHVDIANGMADKLRPAEMIELLESPALAGLEFATKDGLDSWFSDRDQDANRKAAWKARQRIPELRDRGLARVMSSDAHTPDQVGRDRKSRTLTRLRVDSPNFVAVRNAIALNPKARCKAETILPASYPRVVSAQFEGGFLDGVEMSFSDNLNCIIGGRGSGKSTALLSIRAALGATIPTDEDPDDPDRMPDRTTVRFIDAAGSERTAIRERGGDAVDSEGAPIRLRMAELGQEETGRLARGYKDEPEVLLAFLDNFVVKHDYEERERELLAELEENAGEVSRTSGVTKKILELEKDEARLAASLKAATEGKVDEIARWATILASEEPLLKALHERIEELGKAQAHEAISLEDYASQYGVDLGSAAAKPHVEGEDGLRARLEALEARRKELASQFVEELAETAAAALEAIAGWQEKHDELEERRAKKQAELEEQGLKVQAGAIRDYAKRLGVVKADLAKARKRKEEHTTALAERKTLVTDLHSNRHKLFMAREATLKRIAAEANQYGGDLTIRVSYEEARVDSPWSSWLSARFGFHQPRVGRLARRIKPQALADALLTSDGRAKLRGLKDDDGSAFFTDDNLPEIGWKWSEVFQLQTMRLHDRPRIEVQRKGETKPKTFDHLSAGQQRSVLLGLVLCAEQNEPLILDQPEDHLDGQYIADSVVGHLESAKERRQIIIATHSANLVVLGDAELVIPMIVKDDHGKPDSPGAVDRPETCQRVCELLEGGKAAYAKRGRRYGLRVEDGPQG